MSGPFNGFFEVAVHNQRVIIPIQFKRRISEEANKTLVVTVGPDTSIALYPLDSWYFTLDDLAQGDDEQREFRSLLIHCASSEAEIEGPGRIRIPERDLLEYGITDRVIVKGNDHFMSLWRPDEHEDKRKLDIQETRKKYKTVAWTKRR
jgi:DNA-binding transcriptional regulator/RsmH inhibitor MraZ